MTKNVTTIEFTHGGGGGNPLIAWVLGCFDIAKGFALCVLNCFDIQKNYMPELVSGYCDVKIMEYNL